MYYVSTSFHSSFHSCFINMAVHRPIPNCSPVDRYASPVASRHNATATHLCTGIDCRSLVSFFAISGPATRTINLKVRLVIRKFSFHQSSTKDPFSRFSNQNWFLGQDQARLARLLFRCIGGSKIIRFRLTFLRCCSISGCRNRDASTCFSRIKKKKAMTIRATAFLLLPTMF